MLVKGQFTPYDAVTLVQLVMLMLNYVLVSLLSILKKEIILIRCPWL